MSMQLTINKTGLLSVKEQIKRQIQGLIGSGRVAVGEALPSANDLAAILGVNRNTVASAYKELVMDGLLKTVVGSGTYVKKNYRSNLLEDLDLIIDKAFTRAMSMGFSTEQITDSFLNRLSCDNKIPKNRVLVIWCNDLTVQDIQNLLRTELEVDTDGVTLQTLEENPGLISRYFSDRDLIVCGIDFLEDVQKIGKQFNVEIVGVSLAPIIYISNEIMRLPPKSTIGFTCVNDRESESFSKSRRLSRGSTLKIIWAGANNSEKLRKMIEKCDVIFATNYVYKQTRKLAGPNKKIINIDVTTMDAANLNLIKTALSRKQNQTGQ